MTESASTERSDAVSSEGGVPPSRPLHVAVVVSLVVLAFLAVAFYGGAPRGAHGVGHGGFLPDGEAVEVDFDEKSISLPPPPFRTEEVLDSMEEYGKPCSGCHDEDLPANPERRELDAHEDIVLKHDEKHRWCLDCHDANNRDMLRLASGALVPFAESHRLCGQCHGAKYRDWKRGIHGRRVGLWNGKKEYRLCVHCHWAHAPRPPPRAPKPPPVRPEAIR